MTMRHFDSAKALVQLSSALLLTGVAGAQVVVNSIDLSPALPNYTSAPSGMGALAILNHRITVGDLNGDGTQDLFVSNGLAFARVYFLLSNESTVGLEVDCSFDLYPFGDWPASAPPCATTGNGARYLTASITRQDTPIIYDIDLDGINELIYLEHVPDPTGVGEVHLQVWDHVAGALQSKGVPPSMNLASMFTSTEKYFSTTCNSLKHSSSTTPGTIKMRIANIRGLAIPQGHRRVGREQVQPRRNGVRVRRQLRISHDHRVVHLPNDGPGSRQRPDHP